MASTRKNKHILQPVYTLDPLPAPTLDPSLTSKLNERKEDIRHNQFHIHDKVSGKIWHSIDYTEQTDPTNLIFRNNTNTFEWRVPIDIFEKFYADQDDEFVANLYKGGASRRKSKRRQSKSKRRRTRRYF